MHDMLWSTLHKMHEFESMALLFNLVLDIGDLIIILGLHSCLRLWTRLLVWFIWRLTWNRTGIKGWVQKKDYRMLTLSTLSYVCQNFAPKYPELCWTVWIKDCPRAFGPKLAPWAFRPKKFTPEHLFMKWAGVACTLVDLMSGSLLFAWHFLF